MYVFIINPVAGNGRAKRVFSKIIKSDVYCEEKSSYFFTRYAGHAEEITRKVIKRDDVIAFIVIGGDGTIHEVINGIANHDASVSFIPAGSGNDFARGCSITQSPIDIVRGVINGHEQTPYWVGNYRTDNGLKRLFVNSIGFGFDAEVAQRANASKYKKTLNFLGLGRIIYIIALIQVLIGFNTMDITLEINGEKRRIPNCWMVTIANHPFYGGGMKIIPNAKIQPVVFPVMIIHSISKWKILSLFLTVFTGSHVKFKEVEIVEATKLRISSRKNINYQVDGETASCKSCTITKQSNSIQIMSAKSS